MVTTNTLIATIALLSAWSNPMANETKTALAIHGGAGTILKENMTPGLERAYQARLEEALRAGHAVLTAGGSAVEAVQAAIVVMEDSELFNAGKGAVFTHQRTNEMDASIMDGATLNAGAASGVTTVRNPIRLAAAVMTRSRHVMLSGKGADQFAASVGLQIVDPAYFHTERRWQQLLEVQKKDPDASTLSEHESDRAAAQPPADRTRWPDDEKFGTVGAVALDRYGNLAAGTSTGGMTNKKYGRIGDSPIIGAGTYADNAACAISATGHGEFFIRAAVAHDVCARAQYRGISLQQAADEVVMDKLVKMGGAGGIIGMDPSGRVVYSFNTAGMYRGSIDADGRVRTAIYK
jgi:beta-aspartyl-peptidase (threonine type)